MTGARFPSPLLREALAAHARGWCLTPLKGKVPVLKDWPHAPRPTEKQIREWAAKGNLGVRTGSASGIVVIDADAGSDVTPLDLPETWTGVTGGDGRHYVYRLNGGLLPIGNSGSKLGPKIDVKCEAGQVVLTGSIHPDTGKLYRWAPDLSPDDLPLADLPAHIAERLAPKPAPKLGTPATRVKAGNAYGRAALAGEVEAVCNAPGGSGNDQLNRSAFALGQLVGAGALDGADVTAALLEAATPRRPEAEARATIQSGIEAGKREPRDLPDRPEDFGVPATEVSAAPRDFALTDSGNGELLASLYGGRLRFDHRRGRWLLFGPHHWREDALAEIYQLGKEAARARYADALNCPEPKDRKPVASWALGSESRKRLDAALHLARSEPTIRDTGEGWDAHPDLLGVVNGVVDLRTGELRDGRREDRVTMVIPLAFDPGAQAPRWHKFLLEVFRGDREMVAFIHRAAGYSITGSTREQVLFLCFGTGSNAKSTLLRVLRETAGPYGKNTGFSTLELKGRAAIPEDLASLAGRRVVTASETTGSTRLNEGRLKALTGEDDITAAFKYGHEFTYRPVLKLWLGANHKPRVHDDTHAFWRRMKLIPFLQTFDPATEPDLEAKLRAEAAGILSWMVLGAVFWRERGLDPPKVIATATQEYRDESDPLGDFLADCTTADPAKRERASRLYAAYARWAERNEIKELERLGTRSFGETLSGRYPKVKDREGWWYEGITLKTGAL